uniref:Uncharacterized protein n=1 Tax=Vombatus ursinus TaxID=29139 RepID=A0A4X2LI77_VOMUR
MKASVGNWRQLPSPYPYIQTGASKRSLSDFVDRNPQERWGGIYTQPDFVYQFGRKS